jgi:hypothetical protein
MQKYNYAMIKKSEKVYFCGILKKADSTKDDKAIFLMSLQQQCLAIIKKLIA